MRSFEQAPPKRHTEALDAGFTFSEPNAIYSHIDGRQMGWSFGWISVAGAGNVLPGAGSDDPDPQGDSQGGDPADPAPATTALGVSIHNTERVGVHNTEPPRGPRNVG